MSTETHPPPESPPSGRKAFHAKWNAALRNPEFRASLQAVAASMPTPSAEQLEAYEWADRAPEHIARRFGHLEVLEAYRIFGRANQRSADCPLPRRARARAPRRQSTASRTRTSRGSPEPSGSAGSDDDPPGLRVGPGTWQPSHVAEPPADVTQPAKAVTS